MAKQRRKMPRYTGDMPLYPVREPGARKAPKSVSGMRMPAPEKRQPLLIDKFLFSKGASDPVVPPKTLAQLQATARRAEKFVFDQEASLRVGQVVAQVPELLIKEARFARPPYETMWIEWPSRPYWQQLHPDRDADGDADDMVGYLFDHNRVHVIVDQTSQASMYNPPEGYLIQRGAAVCPFIYDLLTEWPEAEQERFRVGASLTSLELDGFLAGSSMPRLSEEERRVLRSYNAVSFAPANPTYPAYEQIISPLHRRWAIQGSMGELRTIIALLLMMNRPNLTRYKSVLQNHRTFHHGRSVTYMKHTVVTVDLDPVPRLMLVGSQQDEDAGLRRRHRVRGHYCHDQNARDYMRIAGCMHDWRDCHDDWTPWPEAHPDDPDHWICGACGGKRWWRVAHERGTAQVGFIGHDAYEVTSSSS